MMAVGFLGFRMIIGVTCRIVTMIAIERRRRWLDVELGWNS